jgi:hypothetical protein
LFADLNKAEDVYVDIDQEYRVKVYEPYDVNNRAELKWNNDHRMDYNIPQDVKDWKASEGMCWVSKEPKKKAMPSLRSCYTTTDQACCKYVEDEQIGN